MVCIIKDKNLRKGAKMSYRKNNYIKFPFIILGIIPLFFIFKCSKNDLLWDFGNQNIFNEKSAEKYDKQSQLPQILRLVENGDISEAVESAKNSDLPTQIKTYFQKFSDYCSAQKKNRDISYIINNMGTVKAYCENIGMGEPEAISYSEVIPFYCIRKFEVSENKHSKLYEICNTYLNNAATNHLSERSAVIVCLTVRSYYRAEGVAKTDNYIEDIEEKITSYQQKFPSELGSNPTYKDEADYLNRFKDLCKSIRNQHVFDKWDRFWFNDKITKLGE